MKVLLSEAILSTHFFERLNSRLPKTVATNFKMSKELDRNIRIIESLIFPPEKFVINVLEINRYYVCTVVTHNRIATLFLSKKLTFENSFPVYNIIKFAEELNFIKSEKMPIGSWCYQYVDDNANFYFLVKNRRIVKTINEIQISNYPEFKIYSID